MRFLAQIEVAGESKGEQYDIIVDQAPGRHQPSMRRRRCYTSAGTAPENNKMSRARIRALGYLSLLIAAFLLVGAALDAAAGDYEFVLPRSMAGTVFCLFSVIIILFGRGQDRHEDT